MRRFWDQWWFVMALLVTLGLAWVLRSGSRPDGFSAGTGLMIAGIFLCSGLGIQAKHLWRSCAQWRLHALIQGFSLGVFPAGLWLVSPGLERLGISTHLSFGFLILAALPTTITSCVILTTAAGGNPATAVVNAALGNVLGLVTVPAWIWWSVRWATPGWSPLPVVMSLIQVVLMPFLLGQGLRMILDRQWRPGWERPLRHTGQVMLLGLVFLGFQTTFAHHPLTVSWRDGLVALFGGAILQTLWMWTLWTMTPRIIPGVSSADRIGALICGSQKTLALGLPLLTLSFPEHPQFTLLALPTLVYHPLQLITGAWLAPILRQRVACAD